MISLYSFRLDDRENTCYTQVDNRILLENYTDLSVDALMVLVRCLASRSGWQQKWETFEKKYKITNDRRRKALKELETKGHCIIDRYRQGIPWQYNYVFFEIALTEEEIKEFKEKILPELRSPILEGQIQESNFGSLKMTEYITNNINTNNNITNNNINTNNNLTNIAEINFCKSNEEDSFLNINKDINYTCNNTSTFSNNTTIEEINTSINSTEEKEVNNEKHVNNTIEAQVKEALEKENYYETQQTRREKLSVRIRKLVEMDYSKDAEMCDLFQDLVTCLTEKGIAVTVPSYNQLKSDLNRLGKDREEQMEILSLAIAYGWPKLRPLFKKNNKPTQNKAKSIANSNIPMGSLRREDLPDDAFELARDENGNLLKF